MNPLPDIAIGAVIAAFITALVSLLNLIISKEQKTSEFRQAWIDGLRADISAIIAHANAIHGSSVARFDTVTDFWQSSRADFIAINQAAANIRLRLNLDEKESLMVIESLESLEKYISQGDLIDSNGLNNIENKLVLDVKILLKKEWLRVRAGEPVFRSAKLVFFMVVVIIIIYFLSYFLFR